MEQVGSGDQLEVIWVGVGDVQVKLVAVVLGRVLVLDVPRRVVGGHNHKGVGTLFGYCLRREGESREKLGVSPSLDTPRAAKF